MSIARNSAPSTGHNGTRSFVMALVFLGAVAPLATAQTPSAMPPASEAMLMLPNSPGATVTTPSESTSSSSADEAATSSSVDPGDAYFDPAAVPTRTKQVGHYKYSIAPDEIAPKLTAGEKVLGGIKDSTSLFSAAGWIGAAGWEQLWNSSPNYGTNATAFGQRFGAAVARAVSEGVFSESFFAPILHEDLRYYQLGDSQPFFKRLVYSGTRAIITKTDSGRTTPNFALLLGNLAGSSLTQVYYPSVNTGTKEVAITFGGSIGGSALGYVVQEFLGDALRIVKRK